MSNKIAVFPKLGNYAKQLNPLIEKCLGYKTMTCPPITKKTVELGAKHSPDTVCTPFKIIMGNFIESLELGANVLVMPAFGCRLGFYDLLHKQILTDLGYKFEMITLFDYIPTAQKLFNALSSINPALTREEFDKHLLDVAVSIKNSDIADDKKRRSAGDKLKIGLVGDLYSVIEPHGNCEIEKYLMSHSVSVVRDCDLTYLALNMTEIPKQIASSGGYVDYYIGGNANCTISQAYRMITQEKVDGIIHMKAATCSPEITAMTILGDMCRDNSTPIMYLTFDTETGEAGLHTRLEAFMDMLEMQKQQKEKQ